MTAANTEVTALLRTMLLIRAVENHLVKLYANSEVPGLIHLSIGQEAVAAGVMSGLAAGDTMVTTHRGHGHVIARGIDTIRFFKELMGRAGGICGGRGGSMHVADLSLGILGANGIVGAGLPIAAGSALAHQVRGSGAIAVAFFGDGAMAEGVVHETINLAALWELPLLLVCENNGWSEFSPTSTQFRGQLSALAAAFSLDYECTDGNDVMAVADAARTAVARARNGKPSVLECTTRRARGHFEGDRQKYRNPQELDEFDAHDPIALAIAKALAAGVTAAAIAEARIRADESVLSAVAEARADVLPVFAHAHDDVY